VEAFCPKDLGTDLLHAEALFTKSWVEPE